MQVNGSQCKQMALSNGSTRIYTRQHDVFELDVTVHDGRAAVVQVGENGCQLLAPTYKINGAQTKCLRAIQ